MKNVRKSLWNRGLSCINTVVTVPLVVGLFFLMTGCLSLRPAGKRKTVEMVLYNPGKTILHPQFRVYNSSETESVLFIKLLASEVVFNQANPQIKSQAQLEASYVLYGSLSGNEVVVRDTQDFLIDREAVKDQILASMKLPTQPGKTYLLDLTLEDKIRKSTYRDRIIIDRFQPWSQQDWLVLSYPDNRVAFENFFYPGEAFRLMKQGESTDKIYVSVFSPRRSLPLPPFVTDPQPGDIPLPDSTFTQAYSEQLLYRLGGEGIYVFHFDRSRARGLCLTQFGDHYPQVNRPEDMLPPLQYITTRAEYAKLVDTTDLKAALDNFWLDKGKTFGNARDLIRVFYNRVLFANLYFPTSRQGWKTDRGMIYLLLGPPVTVDRTETRETWTYVSSNNGEKVIFEFNLVEDFWTGYDYQLNRKEDFRNIWNRAVNSWRKGRIFSM